MKELVTCPRHSRNIIETKLGKIKKYSNFLSAASRPENQILPKINRSSDSVPLVLLPMFAFPTSLVCLWKGFSGDNDARY